MDSRPARHRVATNLQFIFKNMHYLWSTIKLGMLIFEIIFLVLKQISD